MSPRICTLTFSTLTLYGGIFVVVLLDCSTYFCYPPRPPTARPTKWPHAAVLWSSSLPISHPLPPFLRPLTLEEIHQRHDLAKLRAMAKTAHAQAVAVGGAHSTRGVWMGGGVGVYMVRQVKCGCLCMHKYVGGWTSLHR